jgi:hypothetical protein
LVASKRIIEPSSKEAVQRFNKRFELLEPLPEKARKSLAVLGADGIMFLIAQIKGSNTQFSTPLCLPPRQKKAWRIKAHLFLLL